MVKKARSPINKFGEELRKKRIKKGFDTQEALSKATGINSQDISKYETQGVIPRKSKLEILNRILEDDFSKYIEKKKEKAKKSNITKEKVALGNSSNEKIKPLVKNPSLLEEVTLDEATELLLEISKVWQHIDMRTLIKRLSDKSYWIIDSDIQIDLREKYILVKSMNLDKHHHFLSNLGTPAALHYPGTEDDKYPFQSIWINFQLNQLEQYKLIQDLFPKGNLHYLNTQLSWLAMKVQKNI